MSFNSVSHLRMEQTQKMYSIKKSGGFFLFSSAYSCAFCTVNNKSCPQK